MGRAIVVGAVTSQVLASGLTVLSSTPARAVACSPTTSGVATALTNCVVGA